MENPPESGKCAHFQPADFVALAEKHLRATGIPESGWEGRRFHWGGDIDSPPFKSLVMHCARKQGNWVMVKLDRRRDKIGPEDEGFWEL